MSQDIPNVPPADFEVSAAPRLRSKAEMRANIDVKAYQVLDARAQGRFEGAEPEPRPGLRSGHIPGSLNLPFLQLIETDVKTWKTPDAVRERFVAAGVDLAKPLTTTCGSGVSACALALGAYLIGKSDVAIYDGSWIDWGSDAGVPVETGPAAG